MCFIFTGETFKSMQYLFMADATTISRIVPEVCDVIYTVLKDTYVKVRLFHKQIIICKNINLLMIWHISEI